jgi:hypothetical protein
VPLMCTTLKKLWFLPNNPKVQVFVSIFTSCKLLLNALLFQNLFFSNTGIIIVFLFCFWYLICINVVTEQTLHDPILLNSVKAFSEKLLHMWGDKSTWKSDFLLVMSAV